MTNFEQQAFEQQGAPFSSSDELRAGFGYGNKRQSSIQCPTRIAQELCLSMARYAMVTMHIY